MEKVIIITTRKVADIKKENSGFVQITLDDDYKKHFAYYDQGGFLRQTNARFPSLIDELLDAKSENETIKEKLSGNGDDLKNILKISSTKTVSKEIVDLIWGKFYGLLGKVKCKDGEPFDANIYKKTFEKTSVYLACEWPFDEEGFTKPKQRHLDDIVRLVLNDLNNGKETSEKLNVDSIDWTFVCHDADWGESKSCEEKTFSDFKTRVNKDKCPALCLCPDTTKVFLFQHRLEDSYYFLVRFCLNYLAEYDDFDKLAKTAETNIENFKNLLNQDAPDFSRIDPNLPLI